MGLHLAPLPDEPTLQAAMYGPLVLAGRLGTKGLTHEHVYGPLGPDEARNIPVPPLTGSVDAPDWVEQVKGQTLAFQTVGQKSEIDVDRKSTRLNSSHTVISYAVFCLKKKTK